MDYRDANRAVGERFSDMNKVHTINHACLTVFGISIGGRDFDRVIGRQGIHPRWTDRFGAYQLCILIVRYNS
jgi:hypothetical protein